MAHMGMLGLKRPSGLLRQLGSAILATTGRWFAEVVSREVSPVTTLCYHNAPRIDGADGCGCVRMASVAVLVGRG